MYATVALISLVFAVGVVFGTSFFHADRVRTASDAEHLHYGFPITWITQDQSTLTQAPNLPASVTMGSPFNNPTLFQFDDLLADIAIIGATLSVICLVCIGGIRTLRERVRSRRELYDAVV